MNFVYTRSNVKSGLYQKLFNLKKTIVKFLNMSYKCFESIRI